MTDKKKPAGNDCEPVSGNYFSRVQSFLLDNGLRIYVNSKHDAPTVSLHCFVATGSVHEAGRLGCGLSHFLEHMLFQGCSGYPGQAAADTVNRLGGQMNAYTSYDHTVYYLSLPSEHIETGIDILAKMLSTPEFPENKFFSEKEVILRERDMGRDRPEHMLAEKLWKTVFLKHPVRHPIIGYHEKIAEVSREIMFEYYQQRYSPERTFFIISGDVESQAVFDMLANRLSAWRHGNIYEAPLPLEPLQIGTRFNNCFFSDPLSRMAIAVRIPPVTHPDIPALDMIAAILGQGQSSRLVKTLQFNKELAVNIGAFTYAPNFSGVSAISATAVPEKLPALETALLSELGKLRRHGVKADELERERNQKTADYIRILRSNSGIAGLIGDAVLAYGDPAMADHYFELLKFLTPARTVETAGKYFSEEQLCIVRQLPLQNHRPRCRKSRKPAEKSAEKTLLSSGAALVNITDRNFPLIDICLMTLGGNIFENAGNAGISRLMARLLTTGTADYNEEKFNTVLNDNAIDLAVNSGSNSLYVKLNCMRSKFDTAVELLTSMFAEPAFKSRQFAREQHNLLQLLKSRSQNPDSAALDKVYELLYRDHPHALPRDGTVETVADLRINDIKDFYRRIFIPRKTVIGIAGDISADAAYSAAERINAALKWNEHPPVPMPPAPEFPAADLYAQIELPREQVKVIYAVPTCSYNSPDRLAFDILQQALNGLSSKLFKHVRENNGLAYSTGAMFSCGLYPGFIAFYAGTNAHAVPQVIELLTAERRRLAEKGLNRDEFAAAKARILFNCSSLMSNNEVLLLTSALEEFYGSGRDQPWRMPDIIRNLSLKQVNAIYRKYFLDAKGVYVSAGAVE
ncbi:MAG: pitrilysin family protein [Victivallales bacterium]|nr:pitrilysin family protein [Victivallales bacterium]